MSILNVGEKVFFDNAIINAELHSHLPYASTSFNNNDEIRIPIQQQDIYTLPSESYLYVEGRLLKDDNTVSSTAKFINNGIAHLFEEIRYEVGGKVIDRVRNPGITTTLKGYASFNENERRKLVNAGWSDETICDHLISTSGYFNVCIPLKILMGFCEDFKKILINLRQELVLIRSNSDTNAVFSTSADEKIKVVIGKIMWRIPHITTSDVERLRLLNYIDKGQDLEIGFRSWELHEYPLLQQTKQHTWTVKSATQLEKPRYVIIALQTNRKNAINKNLSQFDNCSLKNIKLFLNSEMYPYDNLNLDFANFRFATLYEMYANFQMSYYEKENQPLFDPKLFNERAPIIVIDCSRQNEILNSGAVDVRIEFETDANIPDNTCAYCLIVHDRIIKYNPLSGAIRTL